MNKCIYIFVYCNIIYHKINIQKLFRFSYIHVHSLFYCSNYYTIISNYSIFLYFELNFTVQIEYETNYQIFKQIELNFNIANLSNID